MYSFVLLHLLFNSIKPELMKRSKLLFAAAGLSACVLYSSCIGSFGLFNKFAEINVNLTKSKFVNGILGIIFIPVYGVCLTADWIVLNTIEFWTGKPLLASVGETRHMVGSNGHSYVIVTEKDGYRIQDETSGEETLMVFNEEEQTWNLAQEGGMLKLMRLNGDNTVTVFTPDGEELTVTCDDEGLQKVREVYGEAVPFMVAR